ncbi:hypothetical protein TSUD_335230 [Trifolium subterraneum]|uniref:Uncharacterized protein n=1 Tax=Trifolium subterraneum TaxID=3900 RepID=A0A2Z6NKR5_TRISU|nr:hypothetical protein TSUD_335230 [Trifolium subterraneum]
MSMESDTVFHGVTQPNSEPEPKRLKSEPELGSEQEQKPKPPYYDFDPISIPDGNFTLSDFSVYDDDDDPYLYVGDEFVYNNKAWRKIEDEDALYRELSGKLSGASFMFDDLVKCTMGCEFYYDDDDDDVAL